MTGFAPSVWPDTDLSAAGLPIVGAAADIEPAVLGQQINTIKNGHAYLDWLSFDTAVKVYEQVAAEARAARESGGGTVVDRKLLDTEAQTILRLAHYAESGEYQARMLLDDAFAARDRLPKCADLLRIGRIDRRRFHRLVDETSLVLAPDTLSCLDTLIHAEICAVGSAVLSIAAVENIARRRVAELDPDAVRARRDAAKNSRSVFTRTIGDGMAALTVTGTAEDIRLVELSLRAITDGLCPNDPRTKAAALSDAVVARLAGGEFTCQCEREDCVASLGEAAIDVRTARILLHVMCDSTTLDGGRKAGYLDGYGPISADHTRELAQRDDTRIRYHDLNELCDDDLGDDDLGDDAEPGTGLDDDFGADAGGHIPGDHASEHRQQPRPVTPDECGGDTPRAELGETGTSADNGGEATDIDGKTGDLASSPADEETNPDPDLPPAGAPDAHCAQPPDSGARSQSPLDPVLVGAGRSVVVAWAGATPTIGSGVGSGAESAMEASLAPAVIDFGRPVDSDEQPWWAEAWEQIVATAFGPSAAGFGTAGEADDDPVGPWGAIAHTALPSDPYRPTTLADLVARFMWGCCSIAGCERAAFSCDLDHVAEFDNVCPASGGPTCLCNLLPKCRFHHLVKTHLDGFVDELWIDEDGRYRSAVTIGGITAESVAPNQWLFPQLAYLRCAHVLDDDVHAGRTSDGACAAGPGRARTRTQAKHAWRRAERARNRRAREARGTKTRAPAVAAIPGAFASDDPPPF